MKSYTTPKSLPLGPIMCDLDSLELGGDERELLLASINWRRYFIFT